MDGKIITEEEYHSFNNLVERVLCFKDSERLFNELYSVVLNKMGEAGKFEVNKSSRNKRSVTGIYEEICPELQTALVLHYKGKLNLREKYGGDCIRVKTGRYIPSVIRDPNSYSAELSRLYEFLGANNEIIKRMNLVFPNIKVADRRLNNNFFLEDFARRREMIIISEKGLEVTKYF
jgi:hypothetical protein